MQSRLPRFSHTRIQATSSLNRADGPRPIFEPLESRQLLSSTMEALQTDAAAAAASSVAQNYAASHTPNITGSYSGTLKFRQGKARGAAAINLSINGQDVNGQVGGTATLQGSGNFAVTGAITKARTLTLSLKGTAGSLMIFAKVAKNGQVLVGNAEFSGGAGGKLTLTRSAGSVTSNVRATALLATNPFNPPDLNGNNTNAPAALPAGWASDEVHGEPNLTINTTDDGVALIRTGNTPAPTDGNPSDSDDIDG